MKILLDSLGCDKNLVDSEEMLSVLAEEGYSFTDDPEEAEIYIINTCCFIDSAKEESINAILEAAKLKETAGVKALVVTGCMAQRYRDELIKEIPEIDAMTGVGGAETIADAVLAAVEKTGIDFVKDADKCSNKSRKRLITTGGLFEYLKIAEGCNKNCTYCVIPKVRGSYRSYPMEDLVRQAEELASAGVKELIIVAQETTLYGVDLYGSKQLHVLLEKLCGINGISWIRLLYCYPEEIYPELLDTIASQDKICKYLDIPIQHISDDVLKRMHRRTNGDDIRRIVKEIRKRIPDVVLRTTLISGFPGETDAMHRELLDFVKEYRFERLGVFEYSREEGTPAARMKDQVDPDTKTRRRDEIMSAQQEISADHGRDKIGRIMDVIVEGTIPEDGVIVGRTYADTPDVDGYVFVESPVEIMTGEIIKVLITGSTEYDLMGEVYYESAE